METYVVYADWACPESISDRDVDAVSTTFRPADESVCIGRNDDDARVLSLTVDVAAQDFDEALDAGRKAVIEAAALAALPGAVLRVVAYTDEQYAEWKPGDEAS